jgi:hypothetical protein
MQALQVPSYEFNCFQFTLFENRVILLFITIQHSRTAPTIMLQIIMRPTLSYGIESWTTE